jgi:hypothetical protein
VITGAFITFAREHWIPALRSGTYLQAHDALASDVFIPDPISSSIGESVTGYCCLGVACVIHPNVRWDARLQEATYKSDTSSLSLPDSLADEWGVTPDIHYTVHAKCRDTYRALVEGYEESNQRQNSLAGLNDAGASFTMIANVLELMVNSPECFTFHST